MKTIFAFGASLTNGWNFGEKHPYAIRLQQLLDLAHPGNYKERI